MIILGVVELISTYDLSISIVEISMPGKVDKNSVFNIKIPPLIIVNNAISFYQKRGIF